MSDFCHVWKKIKTVASHKDKNLTISEDCGTLENTLYSPAECRNICYQKQIAEGGNKMQQELHLLCVFLEQ